MTTYIRAFLDLVIYRTENEILDREVKEFPQVSFDH